MLVSRLGRPIDTVSRVLLVLPPAIGHHEGFSESIYLVKRLAENLGVPLRAIAVGSHLSPGRYERLIGEVDPEMAVTVGAVDGWTGLHERLMEGERSDLVVPVKPERVVSGGHRSSGDSPDRSWMRRRKRSSS